MKETFIKKYWSEQDITFYIHFQNDEAMRQIEISNKKAILTSSEKPVSSNSVLYDQNLSSLEINFDDIITRLDFEKIWKKYD